MGVGCFKSTIKKGRLSLSLTEKPSGLAKQIREEIGVNLNKRMNESSSTKTKLSEAIEAFFVQEHITRVCPDKNKCVLDTYTNKMVQLRYRLGSLRCLHQLFCMEREELDCSLSAFVKNVPSYIAKPRDQDWGTCLCILCINPQLKLERLTALKLINYVDFESISDDQFTSLLLQLNVLQEKNNQEDIAYSEWQKIPNPKPTKTGKKENKIPRRTSKHFWTS